MGAVEPSDHKSTPKGTSQSASIQPTLSLVDEMMNQHGVHGHESAWNKCRACEQCHCKIMLINTQILLACGHNSKTSMKCWDVLLEYGPIHGVHAMH